MRIEKVFHKVIFLPCGSGNHRRNFVPDWEPGSAPQRKARGLSLALSTNQPESRLVKEQQVYGRGGI
jgi:hypothetical protein